MAVTEAARQAKKAGVKKLKINTDSKFLIKCVTEWMKKWKVGGWKTANNKPVVNKEELIELESALSTLEVTWVSKVKNVPILKTLEIQWISFLMFPKRMFTFPLNLKSTINLITIFYF